MKKSEYVRKICRLANLVDMYEASIAEANNSEKKLEEENGRRQRLLCTEKQVQKRIADNNELKNRQVLQLHTKSTEKKVLGLFLNISVYKY